MIEVLAHLERRPDLGRRRARRARRLGRLFDGYQATVDWPGCSFYRELMRQYPEAKVILTVRDPERWYDSARQTIYFVARRLPGLGGACSSADAGFRRMIDRIIWDGTFQGRFEDRAFAIEVVQPAQRAGPSRCSARTACWSTKSARAGSPSARSSASRPGGQAIPARQRCRRVPLLGSERMHPRIVPDGVGYAGRRPVAALILLAG